MADARADKEPSRKSDEVSGVESVCGDPAFHRCCNHAGWRAASATIAEVNAARDAATYASRDLGLDLISIRFFEPGPPYVVDAADLSDNSALVQLHAGWFDDAMKGKAVHPETTPMLTVWIRTGLSPTLTVAVVLHEARHLWQIVTDHETEDDERDAESYMWNAAVKMGLSVESVTEAMRESQKGGA